MPFGTVIRTTPNTGDTPGLVWFASAPDTPFARIGIVGEEADKYDAQQGQRLAPGTEDLLARALPPSAATRPAPLPTPPSATIHDVTGQLPAMEFTQTEAAPAPPVASRAAPGGVGAAPSASEEPTFVPSAPRTAGEAASQYAAGAQTEAQGIAGRAEAEAGQSRALATLYDRVLDEDRNLAKTQAEHAQDQRDAEGRVNRAYQDSLAAFSASHVDPNRFWHTRTTGQSIAAAIGMALGSYASTIAHTPNFALGIINDAIERDIDAQKNEMQRAEFGLESQRTLLGDMRTRIHDDRLAEEATRAALWQRVEHEAAGLVQRGAADAAGAGAQITIGQIQQRAAEHGEQFREVAAREEAARIAQQRRMASAGVRRAPTEPPPGGQITPQAYGAMPEDLRRRAWEQYLGHAFTPAPGSRGAGTRSPQAAQLAGVESAIARYETAIHAAPDLPGIGPIAQLRPRLLSGQTGRELLASQEGLVNAIATLSGRYNSERAALIRHTYGLQSNATEDEVRDGLRQLRADYNARRGVFAEGVLPDEGGAAGERERGVDAADIEHEVNSD